VGERDDELATLYRSHHREAVRLAWALCRDAGLAQELAQEAFVRVYLRRGALRDAAAAPAYLRRTVVNLAHDAGRRAGRQRATVDRLSASPEIEWVDDPTAALDPVRSSALLDAVAALPRRRQACVVLRYYLDLTEAETAVALGVSVGTVKSQTHKALAALRAVASERGLAPDTDSTGASDHLRSTAAPTGED
jgi:RNA polymerase sigma-70 factor (sigma-E family)